VADKFTEAVIGYLNQKGILQVHTHYPIAGMYIDLLLIKDGRLYGIDLIGYPSIHADAFSLERYRMLKRMHLPLFALPYRLWEQEREKAVHALDAFLGC
jgi:hypothetical protein